MYGRRSVDLWAAMSAISNPNSNNMSDDDGPKKKNGATAWNQRYGDPNVYTYGTEPNTFLKDTVTNLPSSFQTKKPKSCLMLADGEGRNGVFMASSSSQGGFDRVVSVDISQAGLDKAKKLAETKNVKIITVLADLEEYDFGREEWDCIVSIFCHLPPALREKVYEQIPTALKLGGYFILESYTPKQLQYKTGGPPVPEMMCTQDIMNGIFADKLEIVENKELDREVIEGTLHTGVAAVVQFVGRKVPNNQLPPLAP